jgi:hypothetical protein
VNSEESRLAAALRADVELACGVLLVLPEVTRHPRRRAAMSDKDSKAEDKDERLEQRRKPRIEDLPAGAKDKDVKGGGAKPTNGGEW